MTSKKLFVFAAALLLLLNFASAFNCSLTNNETYCNQVENFNITMQGKDLLYSTLLYSDTSFPNHKFIEDYNLKIKVDSPPENTTTKNSKYIKNAWMSFFAVFPSVYENNSLYVPYNTKALSEYNYYLQIPQDYSSSEYPSTNQGDCRRTYNLIQNDSKIKYYFNDNYQCEGKYSNLSINSDGTIKSELIINMNVKIEHYYWYTYCCAHNKYGCTAYCHRCQYKNTEYDPDSVAINEEKQVKLYTKTPYIDLFIVDNYYNVTKGKFYAENYSFFQISFNESYITSQKYYYDVIFDKKPYYFAYLNAHNFSKSTLKNLYVSNDTFFVKNLANCSLISYNHFYNFSSDCDLNVNYENLSKLNIEEKNSSLNLLFYIVVLLGIIYLIYRIAKSQFKKMIIPIILLIIFMPFVFAAEQQQEECGITNLAECIPQKIYDFVLVLINSPLLPMLMAIEGLLTTTASADIFYHVWDIVRYILSFFYVFLFIYAGYIFLTSNANPIKRSQAKDMLKDTLLMIILVQGSFYIYGLLLTISSSLNSSIISMIDPHFFLLTVDNVTNIGLELLMGTAYGLTLFITMLMLVVRYIVVSFGVVLFPLAIFCYFIPPLKGYGKFMLETIGIFIFIAFIDLLIILACSMMINIPLFENIKIMVMISCFGIVNYTLWLAIKFAMKKSTDLSIKDDIAQAAKYIALLA